MMSPARRMGLALLLATGMMLAVVPGDLQGLEQVEDPSPGLDPVVTPQAPHARENTVDQSMFAPAWYTAELHERVLKAAEQGLGYDTALNESVPVRWNFIQPGARMIWPKGCSMAFVLEPGDKITTAGHCLDGKTTRTSVEDEEDRVRRKVENGTGEDPPGGEHPVSSQLGPVWEQFPDDANHVVLTAGMEGHQVLVAIGTKAADTTDDRHADVGIVDIDDAFLDNVDPAVAGIGGPTGVYREPINEDNPVPVKHIGWGVGSPGAPRAGIAVDEVPHPDRYFYYCACATTHGDSGSPVLAVDPDQPNKPFGLALGIHSGGPPGSVIWWNGDPGIASGTRVTWLEDEANHKIMMGTIPDPVEPTPPGWLTEALSRVDECMNDASYLAENAPAAGEYEMCGYASLFIPEIQKPFEPAPSGSGTDSPKAGLCVYHWLASPCLTDRTPSQLLPTVGDLPDG